MMGPGEGPSMMLTPDTDDTPTPSTGTSSGTIGRTPPPETPGAGTPSSAGS